MGSIVLLKYSLQGLYGGVQGDSVSRFRYFPLYCSQKADKSSHVCTNQRQDSCDSFPPQIGATGATGGNGGNAGISGKKVNGLNTAAKLTGVFGSSC